MYNWRENAYHNWDHAVTGLKLKKLYNFFSFIVAHQMAYLLRESKVLSKILSPIEKYSLLLAAICHDVDHTGKTN